jgi:hypothetical protein
MARDWYLRRIEQLEAEAAAQEPRDSDDSETRLAARLEQMTGEREAFAALSVDGKDRGAAEADGIAARGLHKTNPVGG